MDVDGWLWRSTGEFERHGAGVDLYIGMDVLSEDA